MPDLMDDHYITLSEAGRQLPGRPHASTLWRWCRVGIRGVRLPYLRVGRRIVVSRAALDEFARSLAELDAAPDHRVSRAPAKSPCQAACDARAESEADAMGI